ncbi:hypothetical protein ACJJIE_10805 [Microbulbifer sp. TRSA001]|uniref:hypothetical protein n=1 Tax=Microbulbifer sp. TRSA001 TaxID=3243381 RepID=UPI00403965D4
MIHNIFKVMFLAILLTEISTATATSIGFCTPHVEYLGEGNIEGSFVMVLTIAKNGRLIDAKPEDINPKELRAYAKCLAKHSNYYLSTWLPNPSEGLHRIPVLFKVET